MANNKFTDKQRVFCEEYLVDYNATQSAIRAGYSPKTANEQGARLLANVSIRAYIDKALAEQSKRTGINADRVLRELAKVGFVNATDVIDFDSATLKTNISPEDSATIQSVKIKTIPTEDGNIVEREIKLCDKIKALELLGKRYALFTDKIEGGDAPLNIVIQKKYE